MSKNNGYGRTRTINRPFPGMTLRDYFAAKAMQGIVSSEFIAARIASISSNELPPSKISAKMAYEYADAMLKEREVQP